MYRDKKLVIHNDVFRILWYFTAYGNPIIQVSCKRSDYCDDVEFVYTEEKLFRISAIQSAMTHE